MESFQSVSSLNQHLDIGYIEMLFYYCFLINVNKMLSLTNMNLEGNLSSDSRVGWKEWARMDGCAALQGQLRLWSGLGSACCIFLRSGIDSLRLSWFLCLGLFMFCCMYFFTGCSL